MRIVEGGEVELLYSTYSPASNHLLALELKRRTGLPWVADFRDLWTDDYRYREPSAKRRAAHRRLEQEILDSADVVVGVTPTQTEILIKGIDKQRVGQIAANIRAFRPPEPYKGKGVKYAEERIRRKAGKAGAK